MTPNLDNARNCFTKSGLTALVCLLIGIGPATAVQKSGSTGIVVDDFEADSDGGLPGRWKVIRDNKIVPLKPSYMRPTEKFYVVRERANTFLRVYSEGEAVHILMENARDGFDWDIKKMPGMSWDWRAHKLPSGAREDIDRLNDSGAAIYVIFKMEGLIIKRPKTIKYVYSSTLPVGTVVSYGKLKVIVASSALDGIGDWVHVMRNVFDDYRNVFEEDPPNRPLSIRLWSDSDNTDSPASADFDNIQFLATG